MTGLHGGKEVFVSFSGFHDQSHVPKRSDVGEWVSMDGNDIGKLAGFESSYFVRHAEKLRAVFRHRQKRITRWKLRLP